MSINTEVMIAVMRAHVEGKTIQGRCIARIATDPWQDMAKPLWNWSSFTYRVKPEPTIVRAFVVVDQTGRVCSAPHATCIHAERALDQLRRDLPSHLQLRIVELTGQFTPE